MHKDSLPCLSTSASDLKAENHEALILLRSNRKISNSRFVYIHAKKIVHFLLVISGRNRARQIWDFKVWKDNKMEKFCDFCLALRPVVYCKADAALLCLSCDAKVHSANTLFNRHLRSILCDLCRHFPACIQCLDHKMFMCRACDRALHTIASQHPKRAISSYTGSPSAEDFAALWGFKLNETDNCSAHLDLNGTLSNSCRSSCDSSAVNSDGLEQSCFQAEGLPAANSLTWISGAESEAGSSSQQYKISPEGQENNFILHQILELKRIQLSGGNGPSLLEPGREQSDLSSSVLRTSKRLDVHLDQRLQHSQNAGIKFRQRDSPVQELKVDHLSFPFSQMEHMQPSSPAGLPLHAESFWQCRSPVQSNQLWPQNMQDIGVCEELVCSDDFDIPDVDMTFQNFQELFGGDQDPIRAAVLHDKDVSYSSVEKGISLDKSDNGNEHDASEASSVFINRSAHLDNDKACNQPENHQENMDSPCPIQPCSTLSFCISRHSTESSGNDCHNGEISPITGGEHSSSSPHRKNRHPSMSDLRRRAKGRVAKREDSDLDAINVTSDEKKKLIEFLHWMHLGLVHIPVQQLDFLV